MSSEPADLIFEDLIKTIDEIKEKIDKINKELKEVADYMKDDTKKVDKNDSKG